MAFLSSLLAGGIALVTAKLWQQAAPPAIASQAGGGVP